MFRYIGGDQWLHGIPKRDLTDEEAEQRCQEHGVTTDFLINSGLYQHEDDSTPQSEAAEEG